jgi:hypothetical protein
MKHLYIFLFLLSSLTLSAQTNYHSGYIVKNNGDTVKGYIDYREWDRSPKSINFKTDANNKQTDKYYPASINGFVITGMEKYISYLGKISMDKNNFPDLPLDIDTSMVRDTVFLKVVYQGSSVSLLENKDNIKLRLFIMEVNKMPMELIFHQYYGDSNNLRNVDIYRSLLLQISQIYDPADNKLITAINYSRFREGDILDIIKMVNKDKKQSLQSMAGGSRFFAGISYTQNITSFVGDVEFVGAKSNNSALHVSIGIDVFTNKNTQKLIFRNTLSFYSISPKFTITSDQRYAYGDTFNPPQPYSFDQYTLTFTPQFLYNIYNKDNIKLFIDAGLPINYSIYKNNIGITSGLNSASMKTFSYELKNVWVNFQLQAGITLSKTVEIFAIYNTPSNINNSIVFGLPTKSYGLGINYLFK